MNEPPQYTPKPIKLPECPRADIGSEIRDLMREGADLLTSQNTNSAKVEDLIARVTNCSGRATALGLAYSQQQLHRVADMLQQRFGPPAD